MQISSETSAKCFCLVIVSDDVLKVTTSSRIANLSFWTGLEWRIEWVQLFAIKKCFLCSNSGSLLLLLHTQLLCLNAKGSLDSQAARGVRQSPPSSRSQCCHPAGPLN